MNAEVSCRIKKRRIQRYENKFAVSSFYVRISQVSPKYKRGIEKWVSLFNASFVYLHATQNP